MIRPGDDSFEARVAELEAFLDEVDRRTFSTFKVTNPATGIANLEVGPSATGYFVALRDSNGNTIFGNNPPEVGITGFHMPMPMYPSIPYAMGFQVTGNTFTTCWSSRTFVNSMGVNIAYRYGDKAPAGATTETQVTYDIGSGPIVMTGSGASAVNPTNNTGQVQFLWPSDLFNTEVKIEFQCRIKPATGTGAAVISPMWIVGQ